MKTNEVGPWVGQLVWVGTPRTGTSKNGKEWKSVDFTLKYTDSQNNEKHITFNTFGVDKVDRIVSAPIDSMVNVSWNPDSRESNGKWWPKFDAYDIFVQGSQKATEMPQESPLFNPKSGHQDDGDLPW